MDHRVIVLLAAVALSGAPRAAGAQIRWTGTSVPAPAVRPSSPVSRWPQPGPLPLPPVRSEWVGPRHVPPHTRWPVRLPWFGLVLFDPYWYWQAADSLDQGLVAPSAEFPGAPRPEGGIQLDVEPRRAMVYVDGRFVGLVDRFSGYYSHLTLPAGPHRLEMVAADYDPLVVDVVVSPGRTATYRASLNRVR